MRTWSITPIIIMFETTGHNAASQIFADFLESIAAMSVANDPKTISGRPYPPKKFANTQPANRPGIASGR